MYFIYFSRCVKSNFSEHFSKAPFCNTTSQADEQTFGVKCLLLNSDYLQVQLLVSNQDVDSYKQIKADLDQLRLTVEKSELWVQKSSNYENGVLGENQTKGSDEPIEVSFFLALITSYFHFPRL